VHYATQDGVAIDEDFVDKTFDKIENIFDNLEDQIENELEEDSDQSLGSLLDQAFVKVLRKLKAAHHDLDVDLVKAIYRARVNEERGNRIPSPQSIKFRLKSNNCYMFLSG
jgi:hypothetical protein